MMKGKILHACRSLWLYPRKCFRSNTKAPISPFPARELTTEEVEQTINDYVNCAKMAQYANYDGVEVMGSEGYLINQFIAKRPTCARMNGEVLAENRMRFPVEIIRRTREAVGDNFIIIYRLSMLDLVEVEAPGKKLYNWQKLLKQQEHHHQHWYWLARITRTHHWYRCPQSRICLGNQKMMGEVNIPLVTTNRINMPDVAEQVLADAVLIWFLWHVHF